MIKGSIVYFGRPNGEQTLGEVLKVNRTTLKIRTLEERGNGRGSGTGNIWRVHKSLCRLAEGVTKDTGVTRDTKPRTESLVAMALAKLTKAESEALAAHFRRGYVAASRF